MSPSLSYAMAVAAGGGNELGFILDVAVACVWRFANAEADPACALGLDPTATSPLWRPFG